MSIYEMFGEYRCAMCCARQHCVELITSTSTGKTQICHTMCVTAQLPEDMVCATFAVSHLHTYRRPTGWRLGKSCHHRYRRNIVRGKKGMQVVAGAHHGGRHSRPERLVPIANRFGLDTEAVLQNVMFARAYNSALLWSSRGWACADPIYQASIRWSLSTNARPSLQRSAALTACWCEVRILAALHDDGLMSV
jgi:hypothetical protein